MLHITRDEKIRYITIFHNQWHDLKEILQKHWHVLLADNMLCSKVGDRPCLTAKRNRNLRDLLCQSHYTRPTMTLGRGTRVVGNFPCGSCTVCQHMVVTTELMHPSKDKRFRIKQLINCKTVGVVYAIICTCNKNLYWRNAEFSATQDTKTPF